jgi:hypothetical protein
MRLRQLPDWPLALALTALAAAAQEDTPVRYGIADWPEALGNHRAVLEVRAAGDAARARIPWRRRDAAPERKAVWVTDAAGNRVRNAVVLAASPEYGDIVFQPSAGPGNYHAYYLPFRYEGWWAFPTTRYAAREDTAEAAWTERHGLAGMRPDSPEWQRLPAAAVVEIQALNEFHRMDPMELPATRAELDNLLERSRTEPFLLFPEDRRYPIRMEEAIPLRWVEAGPGKDLEGEACRGEFYAFQVGVYACRETLTDLEVTWTDLRSPQGGVIPAAASRCLNLGGTDWQGQPFRRTVNVPQGAVQALWFGVAVPAEAAPAIHAGTVTIRPAGGASRTVAIRLAVRDEQIAEGGDHDLWRQARLRWLDSTIGLDDEVFAPFTPVAWEAGSATARILGRTLQLAPGGLPASIRSTFTASVGGTDAPSREVLARPLHFGVTLAGAEMAWAASPVALVRQASGGVWWRSTAVSGDLTLSCEASLECDGYADYRLTLRSSTAQTLDNAVLELPFRADVARYMIGMGREGGRRPAAWDWRWDLRYANNHLWLGDVNAGLQCKLKNVTPHWGLYGLQDSGLYRDWAGDGTGGCSLREEGDTVVVRAFTGPLRVDAGQERHFNFGLLITPVRALDRDHWRWRYFHQATAEPVTKVATTGATVINLHQGDALNPHINYPFVTADRLAAYAREAHAAGMKVKIYYTVRELSNYTAEFWALRSLGDEVFRNGPGYQLADHFREQDAKKQDGPATGSSWLCEHVIRNYAPAWHQPLGNGHYDAALAQQGLSRWHNYYLEGLGYLVRHVGIDGLYLDGIGYDRQVMKRVRKVMQRARPGCLIDFHSGNNFAPQYGLNNVAGQYLELLPCIDSVWFGEGFDYNRPPDYWLIELAGIPFGLFGEMLQGGGNPWRGMVYGMTNRLGWGGDPRPIWKLWDEFGIDQAQMLGYWDPACPVRTGREDILATAYVRNGPTPSCLVALASWAPETTAVPLAVDWAALGIAAETATLYAPEVAGFQREFQWRADQPLPVTPGRGWLLLLEKAPRTLTRKPPVDPFSGLAVRLDDRFAPDPLPGEWTAHLSGAAGTAVRSGAEGLLIEAAANHVAFVSRSLPAGAVAVRCEVDPSTDRGATWGPGLALRWPDGRALRVNLRAEGRFGVYGHGGEVLGGQWLPGERYHFGILLTTERIEVLASCDGASWETLSSVPRSAFPGEPAAVLVGKMGIPSVDTDFTDPGPAGRCRILGLQVFSPER